MTSRNKITAIWRRFIIITRAPFLTASLGSVLAATAIAYRQVGEFHPGLFLLTLTGTISAHLGANVINDYYDYQTGNDDVNPYFSPFTGGSRAIQNGLITPGRTLMVAIGFFCVAILIGLYLDAVTKGHVVLCIGFVGIFCGIAYSAKPLQLAYRGWGELAIVLAYGPVIGVGSYYVQAEQLDAVALIATLPLGILVGLILMINEFQDQYADAKVGKRTIVVRLRDKRQAARLFIAIIILNYAWLLLFTLSGLFPVWTLLVFFTVPLFIKIYRVLRIHYAEIEALLPANAATIQLHLATSLLLSLAFGLDALV